MRDRLQLPLHFDGEAMRRDLQRLQRADWIDHFVNQNYEGTWSALPLRAPAGARHPIETIYSSPSCDAFVDTALLAQCPYFQQVLAEFDCPLQAVRLLKLTPGSIVKPHNDHDLATEYGKVRLHIPIVTNPDVDFRLNGEPVVMREGECWYLRLSDSHSVVNGGQTDRVHLVIDALVNRWLEEKLIAAEQCARQTPRDRPAAIPDLERFRALVRKDASLQARLSGVVERSAFMDLAIEIASELGCHVTVEKIRNAMWERRPMAAGALTGWIPFRVRPDGDRHTVDWCSIGGDTFTPPFFEQTVQRCLAKPFNQLFATATPIETLIEWQIAPPCLTPTAFIFHSSRCGSTLFSQLASALPRTVVISEAPPVDQILRARVAESERVQWLRALMNALGQRRRGDEEHFFVKFDAWHVMDLPLIQRAFPDVPCVFLYRHPAEVIASQTRMPGVYMIPGMLDPALMGLDLPGVLRMDTEEYRARVLALLFAAALEHATSGRVSLMNYSDLPEAASKQLLAWCGLTATADVRERFERVVAFDAKTPSLPYDTADVTTRPAPSPRTIDLAARFVVPYYEQLESIRLRQ